MAILIRMNIVTYSFMEFDVAENANASYSQDINMSSAYSGESLYVSSSTLEKLNIVIRTIVIPIISLFGIIGNIMSLVVLRSGRMRKNASNSCLIALSISDLLFLLHSMVFASIEILTVFDKPKGAYIRAIIFPYLGAYGSIVTARITSWITLLLGVERFIAVRFPIKSRVICNKVSSVTTIIMIYVTTSLLFLPYPLKYTMIYGSSNISGIIKPTARLGLTDLGHNKRFFEVYGTILNILFRFLPVITLLILNIIIIRVSRKTWSMRREMNSYVTKGASMSGDQIHFTVMLVTVCFVFLVCIVPGAIHSLISHTWKDYNPWGKAKNLFMLVFLVTYLLEIINSSVNFVIYMVMSKKFNKTFRTMVSCTKQTLIYGSSMNSQSRDISPLVESKRYGRNYSSHETRIYSPDRKFSPKGSLRNTV